MSKGFSLIEVVVSSALVSLFTVFVVGMVSLETRAMERGSSQIEIRHILESGVEEVRSIAESDFDLLQNGTFGIDESNPPLAFESGSDIFETIEREVGISDGPEDDTKRVIVSVEKEDGEIVEFYTLFSNWREQGVVGDVAYLNVDIGDLDLKSGGRSIRDIVLENFTEETVTITHLTFSWTNVPGSRRIQRVRVDNSFVWRDNGPGSPSGLQSSGTQLDVVDFEIGSGEDVEFSDLRFNADMEGGFLTIQFFFSDGATQTVEDIELVD